MTRPTKRGWYFARWYDGEMAPTFFDGDARVLVLILPQNLTRDAPVCWRPVSEVAEWGESIVYARTATAEECARVFAEGEARIREDERRRCADKIDAIEGPQSREITESLRWLTHELRGGSAAHDPEWVDGVATLGNVEMTHYTREDDFGTDVMMTEHVVQLSDDGWTDGVEIRASSEETAKRIALVVAREMQRESRALRETHESKADVHS
jgi:hypothetical protein